MKKWNALEGILCLLIMASCTKTEKLPVLERGTAVITGKVYNLSENNKTIRFAAESSVEKRIEHTAHIDSEGNFRSELELYHPQDVRGFFKKKSIRLYLRPSDSIHIELDEALFSKENLPDFRISGTSPDAEISTEIKQYVKYCGENSFHPDAKGKSVKEFHGILIEEINRQDSLLEVFCETVEVSNEFKHWAQRDIRYSVSNYLLSYRFANRNIEGDLFDESLFPVNDDNAIVASLYPLHLRHYSLNLGIWQDTATLHLMQSGENVDAYQRCLDKIIGTVEKGLSRDIMCYRLLLDLFGESFDDYKIVSKKNGSYIENEILKSVLLEKESEYQNQKALDILFLDPESNKEEEVEGDFWKELKERYKGRVIYLDIWATWCSPCKIEIPHARKLHKYFEAEEEIAFVNLCLASNRNEWETMIQTNDIKGDNILLSV